MLNRLINRLEKAMGGEEQGSKKVSTFRWLIVIGCLGLALMILSSFFSVRQEVVPPEVPTEQQKETSATGFKKEDPVTVQDYEEAYETQLAEVLSKIVGVDDVSVIVNLESSEESIYERDIRDSERVTNEKDRNGGNRRIQEHNQDEKVVLYKEGNGDRPILVKKVKPKTRGVLVVAKGVENLKVKAAMIEAIQKLLDVPVHRISVQPKG